MQQASRLKNVKLADLAGIELGLGNGQTLTLQIDILPGHLSTFLVGSHEQIIIGNFGYQADHRGIIVGDAGIEFGGGGLYLAGKPAPEIKFPAQIEADVVTFKGCLSLTLARG